MDQEEIINSIEKLNAKEHDLLIVKASSNLTHGRMRHLLSSLRNIGIKNHILFLYENEKLETIDRDRAVRILKDLLRIEKKDILDEILR